MPSGRGEAFARGLRRTREAVIVIVVIVVVIVVIARAASGLGGLVLRGENDPKQAFVERVVHLCMGGRWMVGCLDGWMGGWVDSLSHTHTNTHIHTHA